MQEFPVSGTGVSFTWPGETPAPPDAAPARTVRGDGSMRIAMVHEMSGARHDGRMWPGVGIPLEVPDWEGEALVADHDAIEVPPEPVPSASKQDWVDYSVGQGIPEAEAEDMTKAELIQEADAALTPEPASDPPPPVPDEVEPPKPADPKQAWMDYAVTQGMTEDEAGMMTKADLMSRLGGRL